MAKEQSSSSFPTNGIVVALLAVTGAIYVAREAPLEGSRPPQTEPQLHWTNASENVEARLWQDPFAAVAYELGANGEADGPKTELKCRDLSKAVDLKRNTSVIGVMLPGAPYFEIGETRRRIRYAVLSGLGAEGYAKENENHIGCWKSFDKIPFKSFTNEKSQRILVLWLNEDTLGRKTTGADGGSREDVLAGGPLKGIGDIVSALERPAFKIVGPYSSDTLVKMIRERAPTKDALSHVASGEGDVTFPRPSFMLNAAQGQFPVSFRRFALPCSFGGRPAT